MTSSPQKNILGPKYKALSTLPGDNNIHSEHIYLRIAKIFDELKIVCLSSTNSLSLLSLNRLHVKLKLPTLKNKFGKDQNNAFLVEYEKRNYSSATYPNDSTLYVYNPEHTHQNVHTGHGERKLQPKVDHLQTTLPDVDQFCGLRVSSLSSS